MGLDFTPVPKPQHKRKAPKRGERSKFSKMIRDQVKEKYNGLCQMCSKRGCHVHHVMPRARGGRNVLTNALLLCNECHKEIHANEAYLKHWIELFREEYGPDFYKDEQDLIKEYQDKRLQEIYTSQMEG